MLAGMEGSHSLHLRIDLDGDADPIAGRLRAEGSDWRPFSGWIALAAALEEARHSAAGPVSDEGGARE